MDITNELIKAYDENVKEVAESLDMEVDETDKMFFNSKRQEMVKSITETVIECSEEEKQFVVDNLILYKRLFSASMLENNTELKSICAEIIKNYKER